MRGAVVRWIAAACLALAAPLPAQVERLDPTAVTPHLPADPDGSVRHFLTGYRFAAALGAMAIRHKVVLAPDDVAVQYKGVGSAETEPFLDVIVYRARKSLVAEAASNDEAIRTNWSNIVALDEPPLLPERGRRYRSSV